jgi:23S rRNA (cytosine1962-C5)-methyltransferase
MANDFTTLTPCVLFEDDDLLVVRKPAGMNTHAPSPHAGEGIYEWLRHREPRWAHLAIIHRLDKDTSGVMVFAKSPRANRSLTEQFAKRMVRKKYVLMTDRKTSARELTIESDLVRVGDKYRSQQGAVSGSHAVTQFKRIGEDAGRILFEASPRTGRTHQIRVQASENGFPILGDILYGGTPASRLFLHAQELSFQHPASGESMRFETPAPFEIEVWAGLRAAFVDSTTTNACRLIHGAGDGFPGFYLDLLGQYALAQSDRPLSGPQLKMIEQIARQQGLKGVYFKRLDRHVRQAGTAQASPEKVFGDAAPEEFEIRENGLRFALRFGEGYSVGLFLDQRENRRRFLTGHVAGEFPLLQTGIERAEVLNTFAYTCGFSVAAAFAGAHVTSVDLSAKYLDWGRRNFEVNGLEAAAHEFLSGDVFDWLKRLRKKQRSYDVVVVDPPTFSTSKASGTFRVEQDYGRLTQAALAVLKPGGVLLAGANTARLDAETFLAAVEGAVSACGRRIRQKHYVPQPPDFPVAKMEPAYLKTVWMRID